MPDYQPGMKNIFRRLTILSVVLLNASCDQLSKHIARTHLGYYETVEVIGKQLILTKIENSGAFLSTGDSLSDSVKFIFLSFLPLLALCYGVYYLLTNRSLSKQLVLGISFVIGGGLGNLYDRLKYGSVTDFIHIDFYIFKTGIFNLADVSIMIGMLLIITNLYIKRKETVVAED